ncbi:unnamed protein product [Camellia sinensis]
MVLTHCLDYISAHTSGTTVTFMIIEGWVLTVASVGDSRCILESAEGEIYYLSADHRLECSVEERERITASGGEVGRLNTGGGTEIGPLRCWPGGLCLSRSIGDLDVGEFIVPIPYVKQVKKSPFVSEYGKEATAGLKKSSFVSEYGKEASIGLKVEMINDGMQEFYAVNGIIQKDHPRKMGSLVWLKYVLGISFRTDNEPFKTEMQRFTQKIVQMMKDKKLFESHGGPYHHLSVLDAASVLQIEKAKQESSENSTQVENKNSELANKVADQQTMLKEQEDAFNELIAERKIEEMEEEELQKSIESKDRKADELEETIEDLKRDLEMKGDEVSLLIENLSTIEEDYCVYEILIEK